MIIPSRIVPALFAALLAFTSLFAAPPAARAVEPPGQSWSLPAGFSFIGVTVEPPAGHAADDLLDAAPDLAAVYRFIPAMQAFQYRLVLPGGGRFGENFPVAPGAGYAVKANQPATLTIPGEPVASRAAPVAQGFTLVALPALDGAPGSRALLARDARLKSVFAWNAGSQSFEFTLRLPDDSAFGPDRALAPGDAVFLHASTAGTVDLGPLAIPSGAAPEALELSASALRVTPGATVDLAEISATLRYPGGAHRDIIPAWSAPAEAGEIAGLLYTTPASEGDATLTATWSEGDAALTAPLAVTRAADAGQAPTVERIVEFTLDPATRLIDGETLAVSSVAATEIVLAAAPGAATPAVGEILIGYEGDGFLRKVEAVAVDGGAVRVTTRDARLEEAFETLDYSFRGGLADLEARTLAPMRSPGDPRARIVERYFAARLAAARRAAAGNLVEPSKLVKFLNHTRISVELTAAEISFEPTLEADLVIRDRTLRRFLFAVGGDFTGKQGIKITALGRVDLPLKGEITLYKAPPVPFLVGPAPFTFEWAIDLGCDAHCDAAGEMEYATSFKYKIRNGAEYTAAAGWAKIAESYGTNAVASEPIPTFKGLVELKVYLQSRFSLKALALGGPELAFQIYTLLQLETQINAQIVKVVLAMKSGVEASIAAILELWAWKLAEFKALLFKYEATLFKKEFDFSDIAKPDLVKGTVSSRAFTLRVVPPPDVSRVEISVNERPYIALTGPGPWDLTIRSQDATGHIIEPNREYLVHAVAMKPIAETNVERRSEAQDLLVATLADDPDAIVPIVDAALAQIIRDRLAENWPTIILAEDEPILRRHLDHQSIISFNVKSNRHPDLHRSVASLAGLEAAASLAGIYLEDTQVSDLSPIGACLALQGVHLMRNRIGSISLAGLPDLQTVSIVDPTLSSVSLADLPRLAMVTVTARSLSSVAFTALPALHSFTSRDLGGVTDLAFLSKDETPALDYLNISAAQPSVPPTEFNPCELEQIDLEGLTRLRTIAIQGNLDRLRLVDLPELTSVTLFDGQSILSPRPLRRLELAALPKLTLANCVLLGPGIDAQTPARSLEGEIILRDLIFTSYAIGGGRTAGVTSLSLANMPHLAKLFLYGDALATVTLDNLPAATECTLDGLALSSTSFLAALPALATLVIESCPRITALSGLSSAAALREASITRTGITALEGLPGGIVTLHALQNPLASLAGLNRIPSLLYLNVETIGPASLSPLSGLANLQELVLTIPGLSDIGPLAANPGLAAGDRVALYQVSTEMKKKLDDPDDPQGKHRKTLIDRGVVITY